MKFFHPPIVHVGGMFLEVKIFKNPNPKVVSHPNFFFKSHQFLVISLTEVSRGPIVCREECIYKCIRIITTKWWLLKIDPRCKTTFGVRFFGFFTPKNMPPYGACGGCKFFFDISKSTWYNNWHPVEVYYNRHSQGIVHPEALVHYTTLLLHYTSKPIWDQNFWIFHSQKHPPFTLKWWAKFFFQKDEFLYGVPPKPFACDVSWCDHHLKGKVKESLYFQKISWPH